MNYISRNYKFDINDNKAFEIFDNITEMINDGLIGYQEAWNMRDDYIMYNETVELFENGGY